MLRSVRAGCWLIIVRVCLSVSALITCCRVLETQQSPPASPASPAPSSHTFLSDESFSLVESHRSFLVLVLAFRAFFLGLESATVCLTASLCVFYRSVQISFIRVTGLTLGRRADSWTSWRTCPLSPCSPLPDPDREDDLHLGVCWLGVGGRPREDDLENLLSCSELLSFLSFLFLEHTRPALLTWQHSPSHLSPGVTELDLLT